MPFTNIGKQLKIISYFKIIKFLIINISNCSKVCEVQNENSSTTQSQSNKRQWFGVGSGIFLNDTQLNGFEFLKMKRDHSM